MLCDEFRSAVKAMWRINAPKPAIRDMQSFADAVHIAEKFDFSEVATRAAANVSFQKPSSILRALPFARAPFGRTWIEVAGAHLAGHRDARLGKLPSTERPQPHRVGYLIESDDPDLMSGQVVLAWQHKGVDVPSICPIGFAFDHRPGADMIDTAPSFAPSDDEIAKAVSGDERLSKVASSGDERDAIRELDLHCRIIPALHCEGFWTTRGAHRNPDQIAKYVADITGEMNLLASFLLILQCRNAVAVERVDLAKPNARRTKEAKAPLYTHGRVNIQLSAKRHAAATAAGESDAAIRQHLVRGHFKARKTGVFFWSPHLRGDASRGFHRKDYEVTE